MDVTSIVVGLLGSFLLIGVIAGFIAKRTMRCDDYGSLGCMALGIVGAFLGGFLFGFAPLDLEDGLIGVPVAAAIGATAMLFIINRFEKN